MKIKKLHFSISLLLLTLFHVVSNSVFSYPTETLAVTSGHAYSLESDLNTLAILTAEASVSEVIDTASNQDNFTSGGIEIKSYYSSELFSSFYSLDRWMYNPDLKHLLSQNIFPFQFFW